MGKKNTYLVFTIAGISLTVTAVVLMILFLLRGEKVVGGQYPEPFHTKSLSCTKEDESYPFFRYDESTKKTIEVLGTFDDNVIRAISLKYVLYYSNPEQIPISIAQNQAALNLRFQEEGLGNRAFSASYSDGGDKMTLTLFEDGTNLSAQKTKYFLVDGVTDFSAEGLEKHFTSRNYICSKY